jgi:hypothetical protein
MSAFRQKRSIRGECHSHGSEPNSETTLAAHVSEAGVGGMKP